MSTDLPELAFLTLRDLRRNLLRLHKTLLDSERAAYERERGVVSIRELLQLVINHEQFAWLHTISELVVRIDEMLDTKEPSTATDATALLSDARALLTPSEAGDEFQRRYYTALEGDPNAANAHREVMLVFKD